MKNFLIAGNWKMNMLANDALELASTINDYLNKNPTSESINTLICPPYIHISKIKDVLVNSNLKLGAQNCHYAPNGAYTGEISVDMLKSIGAEYVIIGHSERRAHFNETNELINLKIKAVLEAELTPILCVGETIEQRERGETFTIIENQLVIGLRHLGDLKAKKLVIAYEPVWAIGTGVSATLEQIDEAHSWIKNWFIKRFNIPHSEAFVLYGGSLNAQNALEILKIPDVNGGLIGGASLNAESFINIIKIAQKLTTYS